MIKTVNFTFMYCYVELTSQGYFFERKIVNRASFSARKGFFKEYDLFICLTYLDILLI